MPPPPGDGRFRASKAQFVQRDLGEIPRRCTRTEHLYEMNPLSPLLRPRVDLGGPAAPSSLILDRQRRLIRGTFRRLCLYQVTGVFSLPMMSQTEWVLAGKPHKRREGYTILFHQPTVKKEHWHGRNGRHGPENLCLHLYTQLLLQKAAISRVPSSTGRSMLWHQPGAGDPGPYTSRSGI